MKRDVRAALAIYLLGPFRVLVSGKKVDDSQWARPQAKVLLKLLALEPKHQLHRQQIMDTIWPDLDAASAAANLHKIIHMVRRALEPKLKSGADSRFIRTSDQHVQLIAPGDLWIDVEEFEASSIRAFRSGAVPDCENALSHYGGDLLREDLYADWCVRRRDQLRASHQELLMKLATLYVEQGQHHRACEQYEKLIASEPSNEEAHRELMRLYVWTGRRSEALRQFRKCCDAAKQELDAEPEESTVQLYRKILSKEVRALPQVEPAVGVETPIDAIAVLPFRNDTGDASLAYLSSGLAESLIKKLSQLGKLRVLAYSTVARYKGRDLNPRRLGRDLMARALATGRLSKLDGALTVTAELVDTSDGSVRWGEQYRSKQTDILGIQEELAREISAQLNLQFTVDERKRMAKHYTTNPQAYMLYLKGRFHWNKRTADGLKKAIDYFENAIERDSSYALAYAGLADCYNLVSLYSVMPPKKAMPKAKEAARKALKIDASVAEAHTSLAMTHLYYDWDWASAEREFKRAIELNPNYATAHHWYHEYLTAMGRFEEQTAEILHAEELDVHALSGRIADARDVIRRLKELPKTRYVSDYCQALVFAGLGERESAIERLDAAFGQRYDRLIYLKVEPIFDQLRNEPRFSDLIRRIGLEGFQKK